MNKEVRNRRQTKLALHRDSFTVDEPRGWAFRSAGLSRDRGSGELAKVLQ